MRIGVVSDTHNNLTNVARIVELFNEAGVERVVHTGDITQAKTLDVLGGLRAPLVGVYGNNDLERESLAAAAIERGFQFVDPPLRLVWAERRIVVVHDPKELGADLRDAHEIALFGHVHSRVIERDAGRLSFNPGECAGQMHGYNAVGVVDLATLETELLRF